MATAPDIDVANLVAIKCKVKAFTVPEKTRHKKYAAEALAATIEFFNALHESKKVDIMMCRADYVHGSTRAFILEVPAEDADDIVGIDPARVSHDARTRTYFAMHLHTGAVAYTRHSSTSVSF